MVKRAYPIAKPRRPSPFGKAMSQFTPEFPPNDPRWQIISVQPSVGQHPSGEELLSLHLRNIYDGTTVNFDLTRSQYETALTIRNRQKADIADVAKKIALPPPAGLQNAASWGTILLTGVAVAGLLWSVLKKKRRRR